MAVANMFTPPHVELSLISKLGSMLWLLRERFGGSGGEGCGDYAARFVTIDLD